MMTKKGRFTFYPDDPEQVLRIKRFLMAAGSYVMWIILCTICILQGFTLFSFYDLIGLSLVVITVNVIVYGVLRSGLNKRFKDPSLTMPQMMLGTLWSMICLYGAGEIRSSMLMLYFVVFVFGVFRLRFLQFLFLSFFAIVNYSIVVYFLHRLHPYEININVELINILFLATVLPWFSLVGSYITKLRATIAKALETIEKLAVTDELTQVYNRRRLLEILKDQKAKADRGAKSFSLCIFDLDHFKKVNDCFGHETGDIVLKKVAGTIHQNIRDIDSIARYGGEEFMLVLTGTIESEAMMFAERLRELAEKIRFDNMGDFHITVSIGVAVYVPQEGFQTTINRADTALYRAKENGRNRVEIERKTESKQLYLF
ncbi:MAG: GGDEF domain-containing protein [Proteobacteria bacterium]|nr:GGDEF domain-containing protein [Pseudomonadota bacterium]